MAINAPGLAAADPTITAGSGVRGTAVELSAGGPDRPFDAHQSGPIAAHEIGPHQSGPIAAQETGPHQSGPIAAHETGPHGAEPIAAHRAELGLDRLLRLGRVHQNVPESPCLTGLDARPRPSAVLVGEPVSTLLELELLCPDLEERAVHIVLLVDSSGSMAGQPSAQTREGLTRFVRELDLPGNPHIKLGVVEFNTTARTLCPLTNQSGRLIGCTKRVGSAGGTELHLGIEEASRVLRRGRAGIQPPPLELLLIVSDIDVGQDCAFARARANSLKSDGVRIVTICLGPNCHTQCLRDVASSTADAHTSIDFSIDTVVDGLVREVLDAFAWSVEIEIDVDPRLQWLGVSPNLTNLPNQPLYDPVRQQAWIKWQFPSQDDTAEIRFDAVAPGTFVPFTVRRAEVVSPGRTVSIPVSVGYLMALSPGPVQP